MFLTEIFPLHPSAPIGPDERGNAACIPVIYQAYQHHSICSITRWGMFNMKLVHFAFLKAACYGKALYVSTESSWRAESHIQADQQNEGETYDDSPTCVMTHCTRCSSSWTDISSSLSQHSISGCREHPLLFLSPLLRCHASSCFLSHLPVSSPRFSFLGFLFFSDSFFFI